MIIKHTGFSGDHFTNFADSLSKGLTSYLKSHPMCIKSVGDVGSPGIGVGNGFLLKSSCQPPVLKMLLMSNFQAKGLNGSLLLKIAEGISKATCDYIATANVITTHSGVGIGTSIGGFFNLNVADLSKSIMTCSNFVSNSWTNMVQAFSTSIVTFLTSNVKFSIVITGPSAPGFISGTGFGRIL